MTEYAKDVCHCGDYRESHYEGGCRLCNNFNGAIPKCRGFRLATPATENVCNCLDAVSDIGHAETCPRYGVD